MTAQPPLFIKETQHGVGPSSGARPSLLLLQAPNAPQVASMAHLSNPHSPFKIVQAHSAIDGLEVLLRQAVQLVLVQPPLPDLEASSFCRLVKSHHHLSHIPVITVVEPGSWVDQHPSDSHSPWLMTDVDGLLTTTVTPEELTRSLQEHLRCYQNLYGLHPRPLAISTMPPTASTQGATAVLPMGPLANYVAPTAELAAELAAAKPPTLPLYLAHQASDSLLQLQSLESLRTLAHQGSMLSHFYGLLFNLLEKLSTFYAVGIYLHPPTQEAGQWMFHTPEGESLDEAQWQWLHQQGCNLLAKPAAAQPFDASTVGWSTFYQASQADEAQDPAALAPDPSKLYTVLVEEDDQFYGALLFWAKPTTEADSRLPWTKLEQELIHLIQFRYLKALQGLRTELDSATQLMSYTALLDQLEREFKRAQRYELPLSIAVVSLQDEAGLTAQFGSELICAVGKLVSYHAREQFRATDWLARTGTSHFAFLLPETDAEGAQIPCHRFVEQMRQVPLILHGHQVPLRFEMGVASYVPEAVSSGWALYQQAQQAVTA